MAFKFVFLATLVAVANAGVVPSYGYAAQGPTVVSHGAPLAYSHGPAVVSHSAPLAYASHGPAVVSHGGPVAYAHAPQYAYAAHGPVVAKAVAPVGIDTDYDPNPSYSYAYDVQDALTGDNKNQQESRQGDVVQGSYSLTEPDGTRRTVEYTADPHNGFNAVVHREPAVVHKAVVAAPVAKVATYAHAPVVAHHGAPLYASHGPAVVSHGAPLAYASHAAPLGYASHGPALAYSHAAPAYAYHH